MWWGIVLAYLIGKRYGSDFCFLILIICDNKGFFEMDFSASLSLNDKVFSYYALAKVSEQFGDISRLPCSLKVLLENLLRHVDGQTVTLEDIQYFVDRASPSSTTEKREIAYRPARVLMQDFTGVPAVVDLAAMREAMVAMGQVPEKINPLSPVDLVIDHSVSVDYFGSAQAFTKNVEIEFQRNQERYQFLKWGQQAFRNFRVVPPGTGICHQVNLEYLAKVVWSKQVDGKTVIYPDTVVGTDSHTTMINGLSVLAWGVGGIEAEAAMLGQAISMLVPDVIGFELVGNLPEGATATDLVLTVTQMLRQKGVVGKFVEFYGSGLAELSLPDRATLANMAPEYGATCGFFPIDQETLNYLSFSGRDPEQIALVEAYAKAQGLWQASNSPVPIFSDSLSLDIATLEPTLAGPKRPQDKIALSAMAESFTSTLQQHRQQAKTATVPEQNFELQDGAVVIAAITSCTNTSNPSVMLAAGLLAKNAVAKGLSVKPWVKTSLGPGSQVVGDYLIKAGLQPDLDKLGFQVVGYGCTTCIGNSGPLEPSIAKTIEEHQLVVCSVLSGNRNFEGRVHALTQANYLASPPLVVAYALAGNVTIDFTKDPLGYNADNQAVYLKDIWPSNADIQATVNQAVTTKMFQQRYADVFTGPAEWQAIQSEPSLTYAWEQQSTYIKHPPYFDSMQLKPEAIADILQARPLAILGDSVTTDHISPAGAIKPDSVAGEYLQQQGIAMKDFNSFGARRGNHEVMMRGTFANIRIKNQMVDKVGGFTRLMPDDSEMSIYQAAMTYQQRQIPLVVIAGKEYGTGSSRDWAAKGTRLLGVKAVIAESYERIHRSNLIGMGVLPLQFTDATNGQSLALQGSEQFDITGIAQGITPAMTLNCQITYANGEQTTIELLCRIDTLDEVAYYQNGGIMPFVLRKFV